MRVLVLAIVTLGLISAAESARAQTYDPAFPVCMHLVVWGGGYEECAYHTMAQCAMSASGRGGQCSINPFYAGAIEPSGRRQRRDGRGY